MLSNYLGFSSLDTRNNLPEPKIILGGGTRIAPRRDNLTDFITFRVTGLVKNLSNSP